MRPAGTNAGNPTNRSSAVRLQMAPDRAEMRAGIPSFFEGRRRRHPRRDCGIPAENNHQVPGSGTGFISWQNSALRRAKSLMSNTASPLKFPWLRKAGSSYSPVAKLSLSVSKSAKSIWPSKFVSAAGVSNVGSTRKASKNPSGFVPLPTIRLPSGVIPRAALTP